MSARTGRGLGRRAALDALKPDLEIDAIVMAALEVATGAGSRAGNDDNNT